MGIFLSIILIIAMLIITPRMLIKEEEIVKLADKNFIFHIVAKVTLPEYGGYFMNNIEKKTLEEYLSQPSEYDRHSIGGYFRLCETLKSTLSTCGNFHNYKLNFNLSEVGVGFLVIGVFAAVVTLGVMFS